MPTVAELRETIITDSHNLAAEIDWGYNLGVMTTLGLNGKTDEASTLQYVDGLIKVAKENPNLMQKIGQSVNSLEMVFNRAQSGDNVTGELELMVQALETASALFRAVPRS